MPAGTFDVVLQGGAEGCWVCFYKTPTLFFYIQNDQLAYAASASPEGLEDLVLLSADDWAKALTLVEAARWEA